MNKVITLIMTVIVATVIGMGAGTIVTQIMGQYKLKNITHNYTLVDSYEALDADNYSRGQMAIYYDDTDEILVMTTNKWNTHKVAGVNIQFDGAVVERVELVAEDKVVVLEIGFFDTAKRVHNKSKFLRYMSYLEYYQIKNLVEEYYE